jgi:hypothetical protein
VVDKVLGNRGQGGWEVGDKGWEVGDRGWDEG